jgi:hypothetical protein
MRFFCLVIVGVTLFSCPVFAQQPWTGMIPKTHVACLAGTTPSADNPDIGSKLIAAVKVAKAKRIGFPFFTQAAKTGAAGAEVLTWEVCAVVDDDLTVSAPLSVRDLGSAPGALLFCEGAADQIAQKCADGLGKFVLQGGSDPIPLVAAIPIVASQYTSAAEVQDRAPQWISDQPINLEPAVPAGSDGEAIDVALAGKDATQRPLFLKGVNLYAATPERMPKAVAQAGVLAFVQITADKKAALDIVLKGKAN